MEQRYPWATNNMSENPDGQALDGCDVRLLTRTPFSSAIHCELPGGQTSQATINYWIHEIWFVISGEGAVWRTDGSFDQTVDVKAGSSITIPPQVTFQFRSTRKEPLVFVCFVAPPFPGPEANELVEEHGPLGLPTVEPGTGAGPGRASAQVPRPAAIEVNEVTS